MRSSFLLCLSLASLIVAMPANAQPKAAHKAWTDPEVALREDPDFAAQGEYAGEGIGLQLVALGEGKFEVSRECCTFCAFCIKKPLMVHLCVE